MTILTGTEEIIRTALDAFRPRPGRYTKRRKELEAQLAEAEQAEREALEAVRPYVEAANQASQKYDAMLKEREVLLDKAADGDAAARKRFLSFDAEIAIAERQAQNASRRRSLAEMPLSAASVTCRELREQIEEVKAALNAGLDSDSRPRDLFS